HFIFAADTALEGKGNYFQPPTALFDFDPTTNQITKLSTDPDLTSALNTSAYGTRMLVLPTGQVLFAPNSFSYSQLWLYTPAGAPDRSWAPAVQDIQQTGPNRFTLRGNQLNGISEGASYGDDAEMSTNYPIVRLTDPSTGHVFYARTSNWSSTGVGRALDPESVDFTLPAGVAPGVYQLSVVANGIASAPVLAVLGSDANDTVEVGTFSFPGMDSAYVILNGATTIIDRSQYASIQVLAGGGANTVNVTSTFSDLGVFVGG